MIPAPIGLLAELTHRCPLGCPYCSNPLRLDRRSDELDTETWTRVLTEASELGVRQVHLSGGEPAARRDLERIVECCATLGLYSNLITSGVLLDRRRVMRLAEAGLDHVQLSIQAADAARADAIAGYGGGHARKLTIAAAVVAADLPLTLNLVLHRRNIDCIPAAIELALSLGAGRLEVAHAQYHGWALANRRALMPSRTQVAESAAIVKAARGRLGARLAIDFVPPDYYATWPKPCMGGWGRRSINVTPSGKALPCHAAESIPGLAFWNVRERGLADIWRNSPAFRAFRGTAWMQAPCAGCDRRAACGGGCRCQALAITGDATAADPACHLSPSHGEMLAMAEAESAAEESAFRHRRM